MESEEGIIENIHLGFYEEFIGTIKKTKENNRLLNIYLCNDNKTYKLVYPIECKEAQILLEELEHVKTGTKIGILRTNVENKPIWIRTIERNNKETDSQANNFDRYTKEVNKLESQ